jgi:hypothetical protein
MLTALAAAALCLGCAIPQSYHSTQNRTFALEPHDLTQFGIAFITPSTVTGQEEEKQAVALTFTEVLQARRPDIPVRTLPQTLSAINRAGLAEQYTRMFDDYRNTSLFKVANLKEVAHATGMRFLGQLKLSGFQQGSDGRFSVFGLRVINTKQASIRLFFQIWDAPNGSIVWEGVDELQYSVDTPMENSVTLKKVLEQASMHLVDRLPKRADSTRALP